MWQGDHHLRALPIPVLPVSWAMLLLLPLLTLGLLLVPAETMNTGLENVKTKRKDAHK